MGKSIHIYINDEDLLLIQKFLSEKGIFVYDKNNLKVDKVPAICEGLEAFYLSHNKDEYIEFTPCFYTMGCLQPAFFYMENLNNNDMKIIFKQIKKNIRQNCRISYDKSYYIGPGIFQDWISKKYCFPVLFQFEEFYVDEGKIEELFADVLKAGNVIRGNNVRLRNIDFIDLNADSFIIFRGEAELVTTIIRKSIIRYEYGSDCIFVYRKVRTRQLVFQLDQRLANDLSSNTVVLFKSLKQRWS